MNAGINPNAPRPRSPSTKPAIVIPIPAHSSTTPRRRSRRAGATTRPWGGVRPCSIKRRARSRRRCSDTILIRPIAMTKSARTPRTAKPIDCTPAHAAPSVCSTPKPKAPKNASAPEARAALSASAPPDITISWVISCSPSPSAVRARRAESRLEAACALDIPTPYPNAALTNAGAKRPKKRRQGRTAAVFADRGRGQTGDTGRLRAPNARAGARLRPGVGGRGFARRLRPTCGESA